MSKWSSKLRLAPEQTPGQLPSGLTAAQGGGNYIVQDIGEGNYAFYAHLQPRSLRFQVHRRIGVTGHRIHGLGATPARPE